MRMTSFLTVDLALTDDEWTLSLTLPKWGPRKRPFDLLSTKWLTKYLVSIVQSNLYELPLLLRMLIIMYVVNFAGLSSGIYGTKSGTLKLNERHVAIRYEAIYVGTTLGTF
jgi:hypothetical protein